MLPVSAPFHCKLMNKATEVMKYEIEKLREKYQEMVISSQDRDLVDTVEGYKGHKLLKGDLCSFNELEEFNYLVFDKRIVSIAKKLIGDELIYFGDSNTQSGSVPGGNHKDNRIEDRENPDGMDWKGEYPLIRICLLYTSPSPRDS